jgi:archaellum component FlaC
MKKREIYEAILTLKESIDLFSITTEQRFDAMDQRFGGIDGRLDTMSDRMSRLETRIESVEEGVSAIRVDARDIKERLVRVEQR